MALLYILLFLLQMHFLNVPLAQASVGNYKIYALMKNKMFLVYSFSWNIVFLDTQC